MNKQSEQLTFNLTSVRLLYGSRILLYGMSTTEKQKKIYDNLFKSCFVDVDIIKLIKMC